MKSRPRKSKEKDHWFRLFVLCRICKGTKKAEFAVNRRPVSSLNNESDMSPVFSTETRLCPCVTENTGIGGGYEACVFIKMNPTFLCNQFGNEYDIGIRHVDHKTYELWEKKFPVDKKLSVVWDGRCRNQS